MSWLDDLFKNPKLGYSPNLEPPGWNLLRDMMMRKIFDLQANPYGYDPSKGQSMDQLLGGNAGRGMFNPYSGGYGGGMGDAGGGGGGTIGGAVGGAMGGGQQKMQPNMATYGGRDPRLTPARPLGQDARMPVMPAGPAQGGMGNPMPGGSGTMQQQSGQAQGGGFQGGRHEAPKKDVTVDPSTGRPWDAGFHDPGFGLENPFHSPIGAPGQPRPPDANPGATPPEYSGPMDPAKYPGAGSGLSRLANPNDRNQWNLPSNWEQKAEGGMGSNPRERPSFDGRRIGYDSPYMFQRGPMMLGSDGPQLSNDAGYGPGLPPWQRRMRGPNIYQQNRQAYFGGDPAAMLRAMGFDFSSNQGPGAYRGTMFNRGGQSYQNLGASHEGAGPGGQSQWLQGQGFKGHSGAGYGGQLGMVDKMMADVAQQNLRNRVGQLTTADKQAMSRSGKDIWGGSAFGVPGGAHGTPSTYKPPSTTLPGKDTGGGEVKPMGPSLPPKPPTAPTPNESPLPATGTLKVKEEEKPLGTDADPTSPLQAGPGPGGAAPTMTDQGGLLKMIMQMLAGGGGTGQGSMPMMDPMDPRKRRPLGFDGGPDFGQNRMKDWGMREGTFPSPV